MKLLGELFARLVPVATVAVVFAAAAAQSPVKETLAYSRETIPGIPPGGPGGAGGPGTAASQSPFPTTYFIYVVIQKGTPIAATRACVRGQSYSAALKNVESPVEIERDPAVPTGERATLVKKTSDDVYQVELGESQAAACKERAEEKSDAKEKPAHHSAVVVYLKSGEAKWVGRAEKIVPLRPAHAM